MTNAAGAATTASATLSTHDTPQATTGEVSDSPDTSPPTWDQAEFMKLRAVLTRAVDPRGFATKAHRSRYTHVAVGV